MFLRETPCDIQQGEIMLAAHTFQNTVFF